MIWNRRAKAQLREDIRSRRRARARRRSWVLTWRTTRYALDASEEGPNRPQPVERTGPVSPPRHGIGGRKYQVIALGDGLFGLKVGHRVVSHHQTPEEANRCIELMEENR